MSTAANLPGELVELVLKSLCSYDPAVDNRWKASSFDSSLGRCSLTCRHWATHIRPVLFRKVDILSEDEARAFAFFVRSSVAIPRPLRMVIRKIELSVYKTSDFRPWMYYIWALLRDIELPNLQEINLAIRGTMVRGDESVIAPPGTVSRVCIVMEDAAHFISQGEDAPSAAPADLNSTLMRLDQLCESLGNQLRGLVIALFPRDSNRGGALAHTVETMRSLRVQMPSMTRRRRLTFCMSRRYRQDLRDDEVEYETALEHVFEHDGLYWANVALSEEQPSPES
ncbi:hypothetical protein PHLGIDRAFT_130828 [Phlebiopsis gigantea 11061_1 CR5-6]|uniref:F-box domain-containing protein n=1 Tax=Phlebiopsis gigantea (strain 11061_1 CR5-6) TaxID=745531 RepID=A0A0C3RQT9_PHLG1|nr:hypothetical protein PHLGIDRAFT_130828 [Phlebiopsis gigantea 11061_1 CR5-6]